MTIWILALVLLASGAGLGLRQGAIRAGISFVGIVAATLFAGILGKQFVPLFARAGLQNPTWIWLLAPLAAFIVIIVLFKAAGFFVHRKAYLFYKYKAGDLRLGLWRRLNSRLGLCIGLLNGTAYFLLVSFVIYNVSYWTIQTAPSSEEFVAIRLVNQMGHDLDATGLAGAARSIVSLPDMYYQLADLAGLLRQNPRLKNRLESYPAILPLAEREDFKQLGQDTDFQDAWKDIAPVTQLLKAPQVRVMLKDNELTGIIFDIVQTDWDDLNEYLKTGKSPEFDSEKLLGRWDFNVNVSVSLLLINRPAIRPADIRVLRSLWSDAYAQTAFVAGADHQAFLENMPHFGVENGAPTVSERVTLKGQWEKAGTNYDLSLGGNGPAKPMTAHTDGQRLIIKSGNDSLAFDHE